MSNGLRDRKKQQTRQAIIESAHALFVTKGYEATTLADITTRANCSPRTFFQYFASKEDLLLVGVDEYWETFAEVLTSRSEHTTALQATKSWMLDSAKAYVEGRHPLLRVLAEEVSPAIRARAKLYGTERMREILIPELAKDLSLTPEHSKPRVLASMVAAILDTYYDDEIVRSMELSTYIEQAFELLNIPSRRT